MEKATYSMSSPSPTRQGDEKPLSAQTGNTLHVLFLRIFVFYFLTTKLLTKILRPPSFSFPPTYEVTFFSGFFVRGFEMHIVGVVWLFQKIKACFSWNVCFRTPPKCSRPEFLNHGKERYTQYPKHRWIRWIAGTRFIFYFALLVRYLTLVGEWVRV